MLAFLSNTQRALLHAGSLMVCILISTFTGPVPETNAYLVGVNMLCLVVAVVTLPSFFRWVDTDMDAWLTQYFAKCRNKTQE